MNKPEDTWDDFAADLGIDTPPAKPVVPVQPTPVQVAPVPPAPLPLEAEELPPPQEAEEIIETRETEVFSEADSDEGAGEDSLDEMDDADEVGGPEWDPPAPAAGIEGGTEGTTEGGGKRRRRRRRRKKSGASSIVAAAGEGIEEVVHSAPETAPAAPPHKAPASKAKPAVTEDEDYDRVEEGEAPGELDDDDETEFVASPIDLSDPTPQKEWKVISWTDLVATLYRPER